MKHRCSIHDVVLCHAPKKVTSGLLAQLTDPLDQWKNGRADDSGRVARHLIVKHREICAFVSARKARVMFAGAL
jgi:hypothetical protein